LGREHNILAMEARSGGARQMDQEKEHLQLQATFVSYLEYQKDMIGLFRPLQTNVKLQHEPGSYCHDACNSKRHSLQR
jgi:hypothetical protein